MFNKININVEEMLGEYTITIGTGSAPVVLTVGTQDEVEYHVEQAMRSAMRWSIRTGKGIGGTVGQ